jgi:hypothetical protein
VESVFEILDQHATVEPERLLFLWSLFEGVPKFYLDCFEQGVLGNPRRDLLDHVRQMSADTKEQVDGYLKVLTEKYRIIERRLPIFAKKTERHGRYYLTDNFLRAWLAALASPVSAMAFRPLALVVRQADERLADVEGPALEKLVTTLYEERSRRGVGNFGLTDRIQAYWDRADTEIDVMAFAGEDDVLRLVTCKRSPVKLVADLPRFDGHVARFVTASPEFGGWKIEKVAVAPTLDAEVRRRIADWGYIAEDLNDLTRGLLWRGPAAQPVGQPGRSSG